MAGAAAPLAGFAADAVAAALAAAAAAALPRRPPAEARAALRDFFARLLHPTAIATMRLAEPLSVAVLALHYLRRLRSADLGEASFFPHACSASRPQLLLLPLLIIANKYINDRTCSNRRWARWLRQDGLDGPAISRAERAALAALDHGLGCPSRDFDRLVADVRELAAAREALCPPRGRADPVRGYEPEALSPPLLPGETDRERTLAAAIREAAQLALERTGRRRPAPHPAIPALLPAWATAAPASALGKRTRPLMVEIPAFYARPAPLPSSHPLRAYIAQLPTQFPAQLPTPPITPASNPSPPDTSGPWPWLDARWALPDARSGFLFA
ncbi:hypothetical protein DFJ74DRAFT_641767 [Hyaloraphidium curvatum]|nr:hypothetical protein DFJ74DRAFT_641767 [Hyaloraphidium curvatum]